MIAVAPTTEPARTNPRDWTREDLVEKVQGLNPSASPEYLLTFDLSSLRLYLAHLEWARLPKKARWHRPGDTRGIRQYQAAE